MRFRWPKKQGDGAVRLAMGRIASPHLLALFRQQKAKELTAIHREHRNLAMTPGEPVRFPGLRKKDIHAVRFSEIRLTYSWEGKAVVPHLGSFSLTSSAPIEPKEIAMNRSIICSAMVLALLQAMPCGAQEPAKPQTSQLSLNTLSLEVGALQSLYELNLTKPQLEKLNQLASGAALKDQKRTPGKASKEYREKLQALRKALMNAKDSDAIDKLQDELEILGEKENPTIDDRVQVTETARKRAADAFRLLRPSQLAFCIARVAADVFDPVERLVESLEEVRAMTDEEWKEQRSDIADEISASVAGSDSVKVQKVSADVNALLHKARGLSKAEFQKQQPELQKAARKIIGDVTPLDVVRRQVELDLANLLSNPRLPQALQARLKKAS
jgi:hypothetical protein